MTLPVLFIVHLLYVEAIFSERRILPLSLQMVFSHSPEAHNRTRNEQAFVPQIGLNRGTYHSNAYILDSVSLSMSGSGTTICHTSSLTNAETANELTQDNNPKRNANSTPFIFTINNCPIISNPESSPFVMDNGWDDFGSSIFFVDCSHKSIEKASLLALVSLTPSPITHPRHTDNEQEGSPTLISSSGLSLCDGRLVFGSGPLVAFSSSTEEVVTFPNALETMLIGSRLVNMTSGKQKGVLEGWSGCQKILDSCVTRSTNHISGTTCIDMNLGGSLLCSNTSFSHCHTPLEPENVSGRTYTLQHRTGTRRLDFFALKTDSVTFRRCTFFLMTSSSNGAAISCMNSPSHLIVTESSFSNCSAERSYGCIYFSPIINQNSPLTISSSLFVHCTAESGAGAGIDRADPCTITDVIFHNNNAFDSAGGLDVFQTNNLCQSNCVFEKCIGTGVYSEGGR
ncbi:hypothetical protein BLNAU_14496 [Blattamonas nauphoetae]|uniref:Right handed beta helix domain-containing protein n=1 Tax=Blattamonas nauphoetae TaxID=2049346 RepID=A0ABQ9XIE1_9EUKA|nr:hypothetical protein BLNAU_14496 [Blattamonas nauphoetae]